MLLPTFVREDKLLLDLKNTFTMFWRVKILTDDSHIESFRFKKNVEIFIRAEYWNRIGKKVQVEHLRRRFTFHMHVLTPTLADSRIRAPCQSESSFESVPSWR